MIVVVVVVTVVPVLDAIFNMSTHWELSLL